MSVIHVSLCQLNFCSLLNVNLIVILNNLIWTCAYLMQTCILFAIGKHFHSKPPNIWILVNALFDYTCMTILLFFPPSKTILLMEDFRMDNGRLACIYTGTAVWHIHVQVYWYLRFITEVVEAWDYLLNMRVNDKKKLFSSKQQSKCAT